MIFFKERMPVENASDLSKYCKTNYRRIMDILGKSDKIVAKNLKLRTNS